MTAASILIAEDEQIVALDLKRRLERLGYAVTGPAITGDEAIGAAFEHHPDLILMDIRLRGEMDGVRAAEKIREGMDVPVVFLTAHSGTANLERAKAVGSYGFLIKPFQERELYTTIEVVLARHQRDTQIAALNRTLESEVRRRELAEKALNIRNSELEHRNAELDAFSYMVAHDLKGLLNTVTGYTEILSDDLPTLKMESTLDLVGRVHRAAIRMDRILGELLLLAGVSKQSVSVEALNMDEIVVNALYRIEDEMRQAEATVKLPEQWPLALGYGPWLEEVWYNYLVNAIRYGGKPPALELGATELPDGMIRFWVRDNGAGLTAADQAMLFTPFTRLDRASARGTGLGLTIVKRIIDRFGGDVGVQSAPGAGSEFYFTLARAEP
ncbi:MAG: response regulator [Anaerolineae bacterium]|nr:response regulator [Anaerolineae bacterium]